MDLKWSEDICNNCEHKLTIPPADYVIMHQVCVNPDCPNYGLLVVYPKPNQEQIDRLAELEAKLIIWGVKE